ncbi:MAG: hypothetical protein J0L60_15440 [Ignavibacteria bacterium]|nr:hypothetical protein [Ignavibacteria bacterium]
MKKIFILFAFLIVMSANSFAQEKPIEEKMKKWYFVMLSRGENRSQDTAEVKRLNEGHMANINRMADLGVLRIAGPFMDNGDWRGIFIMDVKTEEEVIENLKQDPAIAAGRLKYEIHPWYGPATIKTNWDKE